MRESFAFIAAIFFVTMILSAGCEQKQKPNLVYVFADQLRYDVLGYMGDGKAITPHIDKLASEGVYFTNSVSVSPVCAPYRASLFTGKYSSSTGMVVNEIRMNPNHKTIAHVLQDGGYETGYIGKWHLWGAAAGGHHDDKNSFTPQGTGRLGFDGVWKSYGFHHNNYNSYYYENEPQKIYYGEGVFEPEAQFDMAIDFLKESARSEKPFALFLSVGIPHDPWDKENVPEVYYNMFKDVEFPLPETMSDYPDQYMDRNRDPEKWLDYWKPNMSEFKRVYYAMNAALDTYMGRLTSALEVQGLADNTILVFTSDHGEMFGENSRVYKMTFYEKAARIPLIIRWPKKIKSGRSLDACINTPDIMPTLLGMMDLPVPAEVEGLDMSELVLTGDGPEPAYAFMQGMGHTYLWLDGFEWRAVRDKQYTYARYLKDGKELLFDNVNDPLQSANLADNQEYAEKLKELRSQMAHKMVELNDQFMTCTWYRDHWTEDRIIKASARGTF